MNPGQHREDFSLLMNERTAYLDNAATAHKPDCVIKAERDFYLKYNANPLRGFYPLSIKATEEYEKARERVKDFIGASSKEEIVFSRNTTESINLVAYSYGLDRMGKGDEIVVSITEHHSNMLPWRMVADKTGATLKYLRCGPDGSITDEQIDDVIGKNTKLAAIGHVSNVFGRVNPVEKIAQKVHAAGGVVVVDAAQSIPHMRIDVKALDADFLAFSGHKLFGPMGIGVLYAKKKILEEMPPFLRGGEMIQSVHEDSVTYADLPHRFEAGTVNAAGAVGLKAAIDYIESIGYENMIDMENKLILRVLEGLKDLRHVHVLGSENANDHHGIISFVVDDVHPHDVAAILEADGIDVRAGHHCAQPLFEYLGIGSATRASFMFYNTYKEADMLVNSIATIRKRMGYGE